VEKEANSRVERMREKVLANWGLMLLRGVLLVVAGIFTLVMPAGTLISVVLFLGIYWIIDGIISLVETIRGRRGKRRTWSIISALIGVLAGLLVIANPLVAGMVSSTFLAYLLGITVLMRGTTLMFIGRDDRWTWQGLLMGILYVLFAIVIIARPLVAIAVLMWIIAILAIVAGVASVGISLRMRAGNRRSRASG